tara:strand:+ start:55 stop:405 length:351 start_codon:yes stop_codon:yes gene_type:complete
MVVKWVKKVILEVPNAPVVTPVNQVLVPMVLVKHVMRVNLEHPMIKTLLRAHCAELVIIKQVRAKHLVCHAYLARMKTIPVQPNVKIAVLDNIKMHLAMTRVCIATLANTWVAQVL